MEDFWLVSLSWLLVSSSFPSPQQTLEIQKCYLFSYIFWGFKFIRYAILQQYPLRYCHLGDQLWSIKPKVPRRSVMSDSLQPHELQHARPPCPSPTPGVYSNLCPLSQWCHPTISSSIILFSCLQSFPASGPFQMSQPFTSGGQNFGISASASVLPMNIQDWFPLRWTGWISL